ncbi:MAG: PDZ domain-containing protein [Chthoniobacterales bacterium]|jgi:hypothetical protein
MNIKVATFALLGLSALLLAVLLVPSGAPQQSSPAPGPGKSGQTSAGDAHGGLLEVHEVAGSTKNAAARAKQEPSDADLPPGGESRRQRELRLAEMAARLAALPPDQALARIGELPDEESRDLAMLQLLSEWSGASTLDIIRRGNVWRFGAGGALAVYLLESGEMTPEQAAAMVRQHTDGNRRGELYSRIGAQLAATDPAAALAMGDDLQGWTRRRFLSDLAGEWSANSPEEAKRWIASVADAGTRDALLAGLFESEARRDPASAAASLAALPVADEAARASAASRIASEWASKDTLAAMQWAGSLADPLQRGAAEQGIRRAAPVGIGAMLTRGEDGLPSVGNIVPGSPAGTSGALQKGDTILAVTDANGAWVQAGKVSQRELIEMVRGEPNTQVSLQVRSPGSSAAKVVTFGRQQLIFRPQ